MLIDGRCSSHVAKRHGFTCLLHEKPFAGVNGSGQARQLVDRQRHHGGNLLDPGNTPHENMQFLRVPAPPVIRGVAPSTADLLRAPWLTAGNDHRLGANEAPPAIISVYLGRPAGATSFKQIKAGS
jgi:glutamine synthetase